MEALNYNAPKTDDTGVPLPNGGASIDDHALGNGDNMAQSEFRRAWEIENSERIRLSKLAFMEYQHPDLQIVTQFMADFGMTVVKSTENDVWYRGYGPDQYVYHARRGPKAFLGGVFEVESFHDLEKALTIPGATVLNGGIKKLDESVGGGSMVTISDPEGFPMGLVHGQHPREADRRPEKIIFNDESEKARVRKFQRFRAGPAAVYKLGHYGLVILDFDREFQFYTKNFNLIPSTMLYVLNEEKKRVYVAMFAHIDRGQELVDHHAFFLASGPPGETEPHVHHCSFEIHDLDSQMMGHDWLMKKGYNSVWGIGRHIAGSQIFDYWWDPNEFMVEHYIDGDIVNEDTPVAFDLASSAQDAAWGPDVPASFTR